MYGVRILEFDARHRITRHIVAGRALYQGAADPVDAGAWTGDAGIWLLEKGVDTTITYEGTQCLPQGLISPRSSGSSISRRIC